LTVSTGIASKRVRANGIEFAYLEAGAGPLVLCLHGFPDTAWTFEYLLRALAAAGYRGVAPFLRGYSPTEIPADGDYRVATLARDALALGEALGGSLAAMVGHDWGAVASYAAATLQPERVPCLVAAAVPHPHRILQGVSPRQLYRSRYIAFFQLSGLPERRILADPKGWLERLVREWSPSWHFADHDLEPVLENLRNEHRLRALLGYYRALTSELIRAPEDRRLNDPLPVPARVIFGDNDGCIGPEYFQKLEGYHAAPFDVVPMSKAGHFMHREQPAQFADLVLSFLRQGPHAR
jgi:pimeloyl-ACP methyl ester carboxylesterase